MRQISSAGTGHTRLSKHSRRRHAAGVWLSLLGVLVSAPAFAQTNLLTNGGFESGNFNGWIVATPGIGGVYDDDGTSVGTAKANFYASNTTNAPTSGLPTLGPKTGSYYALSDMNAKSNVALLQSFTATSSVVNISFDMYVYDWSGASAYDSAAGLNYNTTNGNQAARVDLLFSSAVSGGGSAYYTTANSAIVKTLYGPGADASSQGDSPTAPTWTHYSQNVSVVKGTQYYLRFGVVDNQFILNQAFDNVSATSLPEPTAAVLALPTLLFLAGFFLAQSRTAARHSLSDQPRDLNRKGTISNVK